MATTFFFGNRYFVKFDPCMQPTQTFFFVQLNNNNKFNWKTHFFVIRYDGFFHYYFVDVNMVDCLRKMKPIVIICGWWYGYTLVCSVNDTNTLKTEEISISHTHSVGCITCAPQTVNITTCQVFAFKWTSDFESFVFFTICLSYHYAHLCACLSLCIWTCKSDLRYVR